MTDGNDGNSNENGTDGLPSAADLAVLTATPEFSGEDADEGSGRNLPEAAKRALAEAEERRRNAENARTAPTEVGGRGGLDPARFGDWEIKGRAIDF